MLHGELASLDLIPQAVNHLRLGADEDEAGLLNLGCELGVFGQEAVTGVDPVSRGTEESAVVSRTGAGGVWAAEAGLEAHMSTPCSSAIRIMSSWAR